MAVKAGIVNLNSNAGTPGSAAGSNLMLAVFAAEIDRDDPLRGLRIDERPDPEVPVGWTTVTVKASEFKFVLSTKTARHGVVVFKVTNKGKTAHDFKIVGKKTAKLSPGKSATLRVTLTKGNHKYICTIDSHATLGMRGTFKAS